MTSVLRARPPRRRDVLAAMVAAAGSGTMSALAATQATAPVASTLPTGIDRLDLPARPSPHAARTIQLGVALAGTRLVSVGEAGIALHSDDEGRHWTQARVPVSVTLTALQFVNARTGWAVGHDGVVLRSDDAGTSWTRQFDGRAANTMMLQAARQRLAVLQSQGSGDGQSFEQARLALQDTQAGAEFGPSRPLLGLWFANEREGHVVGAFGQIFNTQDGGSSWTYLGGRLPNPDGLHLQAIRGHGTDRMLVAAEAGRVFRSDDRGETWQCLDTAYAGTIFGVLALDGPPAQLLLAHGFAGRVFRSGDGGRHWSAIDPEQKRPTLVAALPLPGGEGLLLGQDGSTWRCIDQGRRLLPGPRSAGLRVAGFSLTPDGRGLATAGLGGVHIAERSNKP